ncbi:MAG: DNA repair protein RecN [Armatimonadetes bacterium]|nr:DNA repair protein RecN [Armatimonadota bacterium]
MLRELVVENFALIDRLRLEFAEGFNVLTGETGAGKSIIIGALGAALGARVSAELVRSGEEAARVEAVFEAADAPKAMAVLEEAGLGEDETIIIARAISQDRSRYWINGRPATQGLVQEVTRHLVDVHGQHEHQTLIHEHTHLRFLDEFAGDETRAVLARYRQVYEELCSARAERARLRQLRRERAQREDLLRFQVAEIREAHLELNEEERLREERARLQNFERISEAVAAATASLGGAGREGAIDLLGAAAGDLSRAGEYDARLAEIAQQLDTAAVAASEALRSLDEYRELLEFEPGRLEQVESRLAELARLKRKYGETIGEVLAFAERAEAELAAMEHGEEREAELERRCEELRADAGRVAEELSQLRRRHAERLEKTIVRELAGVGMKQAVFGVEFRREPAEDEEGLPGADGQVYRATEDGLDAVRFLLSANPGEPARPLSQVASGGELSRLMLVFKSVCGRGGEIPTLVFDEVDVGIGGLTGHAVGRKLAELGGRAQVLCVTHLPQIACRASHHLLVEKAMRKGRTVVVVRHLGAEERVEELARMLGGRRDHTSALSHARQLLAEAAQERARSKVKSR